MADDGGCGAATAVAVAHRADATTRKHWESLSEGGVQITRGEVAETEGRGGGRIAPPSIVCIPSDDGCDGMRHLRRVAPRTQSGLVVRIEGRERAEEINSGRQWAPCVAAPSKGVCWAARHAAYLAVLAVSTGGTSSARARVRRTEGEGTGAGWTCAAVAAGAWSVVRGGKVHDRMQHGRHDTVSGIHQD